MFGRKRKEKNKVYKKENYMNRLFIANAQYNDATYFYVYDFDEFSGEECFIAYSIRVKSNGKSIIYTNDLWPWSIITQPHIEPLNWDNSSFLEKIFEVDVDEVITSPGIMS